MVHAIAGEVGAEAVVGFGNEVKGRVRMEAVARTVVSWQRAHEELLKIAKKRAGLEFEEGRWLLQAFRARAHAELGFGSFHEYAERLFGHSPRLTLEKLRVAEALEGLGETARELESGRISFSAVRELSRVATAETEREWLEAARGRTVREIETMVSGHRPGSRPDDAPDPGEKRHVLKFEVSGEVLATFREAQGKIRRDAAGPLDDDDVLLLFARHVLGGPKEEGRSSYQIAFTVCEQCGKGMQHGRGELIEVAPEIIEMACCDAQYLGHIEVHTHVGKNHSARDGETHVGADASGHDCDGHVGEQPSRATQSIPPAVRRAVRHRDQGRCRVPGCRNAIFVDLHHRDWRLDGGGNTLVNLITLCGAHHHAVHLGKLFVESTPAGLRFFHADGTVYGSSCCPATPQAGAKAESARSPATAGARAKPETALSPATAEARAKAESALRIMGFSVKDVRFALARIPKDSHASLEALVRQGLAELAEQ
jgi:hypothetical protein